MGMNIGFDHNMHSTQINPVTLAKNKTYIVLFSTSPTSLKSMLNDVETYCNAFGLKINVAKTKALIFEKSTRHSHYDFFLYNEKIETLTSFENLGVYCFKNGNWHR